MEQSVIPVHQWTDGGAFVRVVRNINNDGTSYGGFVNPLVVGETVTAPDWRNDEACGGGIHGWPWGLYVGDGKAPKYGELWQVVEVEPTDIVWLGGKVKFREGRVVYCGSWAGALGEVQSGQIRWIEQGAHGAASATGDHGAASATGDQGAASATGQYGAASATGEHGAASATGWHGAASATGWYGAASATGQYGAASATGAHGAASATGQYGAASATGEYGAASATGERSFAAVTGMYGRAMCGEGGCIALAYEQPDGKTVMHCASVAQNGIRPNVWYTLNDAGEFVEVGA